MTASRRRKLRRIVSSEPKPQRWAIRLTGVRAPESFTEAQVQIVLLTDAVTNGSTWAVAFHTALALKEGIDPADVQAIRDGRLPKDDKFAALSGLARTMIEKRGHLDDQEIDRFLAAEFGRNHLLEVIAAVAASTITNYAGSIAKPPLEAPFQEYAWAG